MKYTIYALKDQMLKVWNKPAVDNIASSDILEAYRRHILSNISRGHIADVLPLKGQLLFAIGAYDDTTGRIEVMEPELIGDLTDFFPVDGKQS